MPVPRRLSFAALLCALGALALTPALAAAETFEVTSTADTGEMAKCLSHSPDECTLRGAIEAANADPQAATDDNLITFGAGFEGVAGQDEILLTEALPE